MNFYLTVFCKSMEKDISLISKEYDKGFKLTNKEIIKDKPIRF